MTVLFYHCDEPQGVDTHNGAQWSAVGTGWAVECWSSVIFGRPWHVLQMDSSVTRLQTATIRIVSINMLMLLVHVETHKTCKLHLLILVLLEINKTQFKLNSCYHVVAFKQSKHRKPTCYPAFYMKTLSLLLFIYLDEQEMRWTGWQLTWLLQDVVSLPSYWKKDIC